MQDIIKEVISIETTLKKRLGILGIGLLGNALMVYGFDYFLYPYIIYKYNLLKGGVIMMILSFLICILTIWFYDWAKKDWIGIETMKEIREVGGKSLLARIVQKIMHKGKWAMLIVLSIKFDPFITTVYMRHGAHQYNGMNTRDWKIFLSSTVIANLYWSLLMFGGITLLEKILGIL